MRVKRIDTGTLQKPVKRADGSMIVQARFTRSGVFKYLRADGSVQREYRPPEQVFSTASMDSFKSVVFTNDHPPEMISAANSRQYQVGMTGQDVRRDGKWMIGTIIVTDAATVKDLESGKTQISNGYDCDLVMTTGVSPDGEHYDCVQTNIDGNHVALVWDARAGKDAAVRMDAAAAEIDNQEQEATMNLEQALAALAAANEKLGAVTARADAATAEAATAKKRCDSLEAERDAAKESATKAEKARLDAVAEAPAKVRARMALEQTVTKMLGDKAPKMDSDDKTLKLAVIAHVSKADCSAKSDAYIDARYDAAIEQADQSAVVFQSAQSQIVANRADESPDRAEAARKEMLARQHKFIQPGSQLKA